MKKDKYEISLWEDYLVPASTQGEQTIPAHYEERKIAVIGSDTITSPCRAYNPKLVEDINGTNTLTFEMFYVYREDSLSINQTAQDVQTIQNPFLTLLTNERKVKCFWKNKWYDFVIKNCQEDSTGKKITYTCKDLYVNELAKNGFSLTFDSELNNNIGTAPQLAEKVLEGTDWQLDEEGCDIIQQEKEEPVYEVTLKNDFLVNRDSSPSATGITIEGKSTILLFYNQLQDAIEGASEGTYSSSIDLQFAYAKNYQTEENTQLVINAEIFSANGLQICNLSNNGVNYLCVSQSGTVIFDLYFTDGVSQRYRAKRLVKSKLSKFDPTTKKYCNVLLAKEDGDGYSKGNEIYEYITTEWNDALVVSNLIVNNKDFTSTDGWSSSKGGATIPKLGLYYASGNVIGNSCLGLSASTTYFNEGIKHSTQFLPDGGLIKGERYILRYKARQDTNSSPGSYIASTNNLSVIARTYKINDQSLVIVDTDGPIYLQIQGTWQRVKVADNDYWIEAEFECVNSIIKKDIHTKNIGLFITTVNACWIEEIQLYRKVLGFNNKRINPGDFDVSSVSTQVYKYYNYTENRGKINADEVIYLQTAQGPWTDNGKLEYQYNKNFEKVRSITEKQSNRFNILQSIAETFECWIQFEIQHDQETGRTKYVNGIPQKFVRIKSEIGQNTGVGFIYGIDLKSISRSIESDQIVTKTIVSANSNEFATNGSCNIARSTENYPLVNYILNFDYYITQGLIDGGTLNKDLYDSTGDIGYYYNLHKYNKQYQENQEWLTAKKTELLRQESMRITYDEAYTACAANVTALKEEIRQLAGTSSYSSSKTKEWIEKNKNQPLIFAKINGLAAMETQCASYKKMVDSLDASINSTNTQIITKEERQEELIKLVKELDEKFYRKYSRFIQEGSWTSEDYIDDNLYFLDAQSVAYASSRPQISYNISVVRISGLEGFENKVFKLGDIAFIQDTEFFGYVYINGIKTPYKEKVLVSSISSNFDNPSQDTFTVQNYKTQFEDLFQRITSTTQSLQYASGGYAKAANIINDDGTIKVETLQASLTVNENLVYSAKNEMILQDDTGITVTDASNPQKKTKITSGGLFITTDGGSTWKNAIRGEGIATQYLTAGNINVGSIVLLDGQFPAFRWDKNGIDAYSPLPEDGGIDLGKFVRFDHFGIYGINGNSSEEFIPEKEKDVWDNAQFGMTWKGFFIKNKYDGHTVEVSSENDIQVLNGAVPIIKIGQLDAVENIYGIRISNASGAPVMETNSLGDLWLRNRLNISSTNGTNYNIGIGYLDNTKPNTNIHEVVNANNKFIVYEDGSMKATDGEFTGIINATGGKIGNMTIEQIEDATYRVIIESSDGTIFKNGKGEKKLTAKLYKGEVEVTTGTFTYNWQLNAKPYGGNTKEITVSAGADDSIYNYQCKITYNP